MQCRFTDPNDPIDVPVTNLRTSVFGYNFQNHCSHIIFPEHATFVAYPPSHRSPPSLGAKGRVAVYDRGDGSLDRSGGAEYQQVLRYLPETDREDQMSVKSGSRCEG